MDLSIIIINWNTRDITRDCLRSIFDNLGSLETEVFLVDNASTDGSSDLVAAEFPQTCLIRNSQNRGFAAANNQAIRLSKGRHLLLLNSDTLVLDDVLRACARYIDSRADVGVLGCRVLNPDRTMQTTCFQFPTLVNLVLKTTGIFRLHWPQFVGREHFRGWQRDSERDVDVVTGCFMMVRRAALEEVGLLDESFFFFGEETDWCKRFKDAGWAVRFAPVGEIIHYGGASAKKLNHRRDLLLTQGLVRFHRKHRGVFSAAAAFFILWLFNSSRLVFWSLASLLRRKNASEGRRKHFATVVRNFSEAWPNSVESNG